MLLDIRFRSVIDSVGQNRVPPASVNSGGRGHHLVGGDSINESTTSPRFPTIRVNLLHAHGSPTCFQYNRGCRCAMCHAATAQRHGLYRRKNPEVVSAQHRRYSQRHHDRLIASGIRYYHNHLDERRAYARRRHAENKAGAAERNLRWRKEYPERAAANSRNRKARKRDAAGRHTAADVRAQYERQKGICFWCPEKVGDTYHVDHVVPLVLGGPNDSANIVIACPDCNLHKGAKHPMDFAGVLC